MHFVFCDDHVILAQDETGTHYMSRWLQQARDNIDLPVNVDKTE